MNLRFFNIWEFPAYTIFPILRQNLKFKMLRSGFFLLTIIPLFYTTLLFGESKGINREKYRIGISKTNSNINIDGILDEPIWSSTETATHFQRVLPTDTGFAIAQTEVRLTYTESTLYMAITCFDSTPWQTSG